MGLVQQLTLHLQTSLDTFCWAVEQVPAERFYTPSQRKPEAWTVARLVFHLMSYDEQAALLNMRQWLPASIQPGDNELIARHNDFDVAMRDEEADWLSAPDVETMLVHLRTSRAAQLAMLPQFDRYAWEEKRRTIWGEVTLRWAVTKTVHHTAQHTHDILLWALFGGEMRG